jgi:N-acetylmuramoyl-L-alanine amidase
MSFRTLLLIVLLVPALLLGGAAATGLRVPVPAMGRDYVLHFPLGPGDMPVDLPSISGPKDPSLPLVVIDAGHGGRDPGAIGSDAQGRRCRRRTSRSLLRWRCAMSCCARAVSAWR